MRDIFGIASAVLIGLITLAFQPSTAQWWAGLLISGAIALVTAAHIVWSGLPDRIKNRLGSATWTPDGKVVGGKLRAVIGILVLCALLGSGYVASRWPLNFLRTSSESPPHPEQTGPITSRLNHFILSCDVPPPPPTRALQTCFGNFRITNKNWTFWGMRWESPLRWKRYAGVFASRPTPLRMKPSNEYRR
jgi:hypothetical protein